MANPTILWYDLETYGLNARLDRIASFACLRTNLNFDELDDGHTLYARLSPDYLPKPEAVLVNKLLPSHYIDSGLREHELAKAIFNEFSRPGTCVAGFNNIRFDDEFIRNLFYRNFYDIYNHAESRYDIIDLVLACHDLRPEGIIWPSDDEGRFTFRLENLTQANNLPHSYAHDALSDVKATIAVIKLLNNKQPKLVKFHFEHRHAPKLWHYINLQTNEPFVHTSRMLTNSNGFASSIMLPLMANSLNSKEIYCYDLRYDPSLLINLPAKEVVSRYFTSRSVLSADAERIHIKGVRLNKCPAIFPLQVWDKGCEERSGLTKELALSRMQLIKDNFEPISANLRAIDEALTGGADSKEPITEVDLLIYGGGFFSDSEKRLFESIRQAKALELPHLILPFKDNRSPELFKRYLGRNYPELLDEKSYNEWRRYCANRLTFPPASEALSFSDFRAKIGELSQNAGEADLELLKELWQYGRRLEKTLLKSVKQATNQQLKLQLN